MKHRNRYEAKIRLRADHIPVEKPVGDIISQRISTGINFDLYDKIHVEITAAVVYTPMKSFDEVDELKILRSNIRKLNWRKVTPVQKHSIPLILQGCDLMACAQTGSGKTGAFILPVIAKMHENTNKNLKPKSLGQWPFEPEAVILAPTRELAIQISGEARVIAEGTSAKPCCLYGGTDTQCLMKRLRSEFFNMLIATPGRLVDFIKRGFIELRSECQYIILDEADRMLQMGFKKDIDFIAENAKPIYSTKGSGFEQPPGERQTLMFSATFPKPVQKLAHTFLRINHPFIAVGMVGSANRDICQTVKQVDSQWKKDYLLEILNKDLSNNPPILTPKGEIHEKKTLVFVETATKVVNVHQFLEYANLPVACMHGRISQSKREEILEKFKSGSCPILIATAIAARGLDIVGVDHILSEAQQEVPDFLESLVLHIGDTGIGKNGSQSLIWDLPLIHFKKHLMQYEWD
uniref:RNA helicase n=1 Tax=Romanomermis culicivorax TaxID=13658 RepID=A0A915KG68_ROMCU